MSTYYSVFAAWVELRPNAGTAPTNVWACDEAEPVSEKKSKPATLQDGAPVEVGYYAV